MTTLTDYLYQKSEMKSGSELEAERLIKARQKLNDIIQKNSGNQDGYERPYDELVNEISDFAHVASRVLIEFYSMGRIDQKFDSEKSEFVVRI